MGLVLSATDRVEKFESIVRLNNILFILGFVNGNTYRITAALFYN